MKVKDLITELQKLDQDKNIWQMYDPPFACGEVIVEELIGTNAEYADMFKNDGVKEGDYAIICE